MARKIKRRTGRKSRRSIKRSIKRDLEKSLRKTIERSIKKSLNKFNKRIKKYKKKKTKKKKIQRGGDATSLINAIKEIFFVPGGRRPKQINDIGTLKTRASSLKRTYQRLRDVRQILPKGEIIQTLRTQYFNLLRFGVNNGEEWTTNESLKAAKEEIINSIADYLVGGETELVLPEGLVEDEGNVGEAEPEPAAPAPDPEEAARQAAAAEAEAAQAPATDPEEAARQAAAAGIQGQGGDQPELERSEPCNLQSEAVGLVKELKECRREKANNEQEILALSEESREKDAQIEENTQTIAANEARIAQLEGEKADLENQIAELRVELQASEGVNDELSAQIQELGRALRNAKGEIDRRQQENQQLNVQNATLTRERQSLEEQLSVATQGHRESEERLRMLEEKVNNLIKKTICSLLGEVIIAITVKSIDITAEIDRPNKDRFIHGYRGAVTWKDLLVSLMKYAKTKYKYKLDSVLGLYEDNISADDINGSLSAIELPIVHAAIPEIPEILEILQVREPG